MGLNDIDQIGHMTTVNTTKDGSFCIYTKQLFSWTEKQNFEDSITKNLIYFWVDSKHMPLQEKENNLPVFPHC